MRTRFKKMYRDEKGAITVWLTLLLIVMLCFLIIIIEFVRAYQAKSICLQSTKTAIISTMADYEPDIYDNYHIFVLDECYGKTETNREKLKDKVLRYANESVNPNYNTDEKTLDIMGCYVEKVSINEVKCLEEDNENLLNQINRYMTMHLTESKVMELCDYYGTTKENILLCEYIFSHFSSYKSTYILGYMKKNFIYEIEYILMGDKTDNDNIAKVKELLTKEGLDVSQDIVYTENEYRQWLYKKIININRDKLCNRIKNIIVSNINSTYGKETNLNHLLTCVDIAIKYSIEERAMNIQLINKCFGRKFKFSNIKHREKLEY